MTAPAAGELRLVPEGVCPACGQKLPTTERRVCAGCKQPILRGHKFVFIGSEVRHRDCSDPTSYVREARS